METQHYFDPQVFVNRTMKPRHFRFDHMPGVLHPELELVGPPVFDATKLERVHHPKQTATIQITTFYEYLKRLDILKRCLSLADLLAIHNRGQMFIEEYFKQNEAVGWRSIVKKNDKEIYCPRLKPHIDGNIYLGFDLKLTLNCALLFPEK